MRVLLIYDHLEVGGTQTYGLGLAQYLIHAGHHVAVASRGGGTAPQFARLGVLCFDWPAPTRTNLFSQIQAVRHADRILRQWQPDILHAHAVLPGLVFSIAARRAGEHRTPVIFGPQRSWRSLYHRRLGGRVFTWLMYRLLCMSADEVIAVSDGLRQEFEQYGVPPSKCHLIPNGVELEAIENNDSILSTGAAHIVGTVCRLVEQKGVDVFVDAAALIATQRPDIRFWIAGDGPLREALRQRIATLALTDCVQLLGERADVPGVLQQMTVFVSASRWEGLPYAVLEALAACKPIVATRVLGTSELIRDGVTGLLVPPDDPVSMSDAIVRLLDDPALAHSLGEAGRQLVESRYSLQAMADQIMAVYRQAVTIRVETGDASGKVSGLRGTP